MKKFFGFYAFALIIFSTALPADDDGIKAAAKATTAMQGVIILDKTSQANSGLKTLKLKPATYRVEKLSYGMAISIEPLLTLQNQYLNALAQQSGVKAKMVFNQNNVNRLTYLHKEGIASSRALQDQQTTLQVEKAALDGSHYLIQQIINNTQLLWGTTLTDWMIKSASAFNDLMQQRTTLLKITFPPDVGMNNALKTIFVAPANQREQAIAAQLISAAPQADNFSQRQQYFYQVPARLQIKAGMRISAWIPTQQHMQTGVIIPESALCWHLGQALVFIKVAQQQFSRRSIPAYHKIAGGYFVSSAIKAGEEIVSTGAQMLLSQEFKGQIPSEDND